jgi:predicted DNA-binding ribbon-helix-helix protein
MKTGNNRPRRSEQPTSNDLSLIDRAGIATGTSFRRASWDLHWQGSFGRRLLFARPVVGQMSYDTTDSALSLVPIYEASKGTEPMQKSQVVKRSIVLAGHKTSVSLEEPFWKGLKNIASKRRRTLSGLVASIDDQRTFGNLSSAVRLFVLKHYQERASNERVTHPSDDGSVRVSH